MRFRWHPDAVATDAQGRRSGGGTPAAQPVALPATPALLALQAALGAPAFRIGGAGPAPVAEDCLETLTGGSTGTPRRILRQQSSWIASFAVNARLFGLAPGQSVAVLGGLDHSLALYGAVEALHLGAYLHLLAGLRPDRQAQALAARRVRLLYATPAQMRGLLAAGVDWPDLAQIVIGGARLTPDLRTALGQRCPARVTEFYGAAETSFIALSDETTPPDSVGRPYPGVEIRADPEGRLWVRSPYLALGYAGPAGGALWQQGWVAPGEAGQIRAGHLILHGRLGRQIKIADQTVQPEEIEGFLASWPGLTAAAVIPRPDPARGWVLWAYVQGQGDEAAILAALRQAFGPLKAPKRLIWLQDWPCLPSGKTDFARLGAQP